MSLFREPQKIDRRSAEPRQRHEAESLRYAKFKSAFVNSKNHVGHYGAGKPVEAEVCAVFAVLADVVKELWDDPSLDAQYIWERTVELRKEMGEV